MRCSTWPTGPGPLRDKLADATGYPLPALPSCGGPTPRQRAATILDRAPRMPVHTGTHGEPPAMADRISRTVHLNASPAHAALQSAPLHGGTPTPQSADRHCLSGAQPKHALAGRADLRDGRPRTHGGLGGRGQGEVSRRSPQGLPPGAPGAILAHSAGGWQQTLPPGHRVVGLRQIDGIPHQPQRARSGGSRAA